MQAAIEQLFDHKPEQYTPDHYALFSSFKAALNAGEIRAAVPDPSAASGWRVNGWVKKGILVGFRIGGIVDMSVNPVRQPFFDKATYPVRHVTANDGVRIVPGGSGKFATAVMLAGVSPARTPMLHQCGRVCGRLNRRWICYAYV